MEIACPRCAARYRLGEEAIPEAGRQVRCTGCGWSWLQPRPIAPAAAPPIEFVLAAPPPAPAPPPSVRRPPRPRRRFNPFAWLALLLILALAAALALTILAPQLLPALALALP